MTSYLPALLQQMLPLNIGVRVWLFWILSQLAKQWRRAMLVVSVCQQNQNALHRLLAEMLDEHCWSIGPVGPHDLLLFGSNIDMGNRHCKSVNQTTFTMLFWHAAQTIRWMLIQVLSRRANSYLVSRWHKYKCICKLAGSCSTLILCFWSDGQCLKGKLRVKQNPWMPWEDTN